MSSDEKEIKSSPLGSEENKKNLIEIGGVTEGNSDSALTNVNDKLNDSVPVYGQDDNNPNDSIIINDKLKQDEPLSAKEACKASDEEKHLDDTQTNKKLEQDSTDHDPDLDRKESTSEAKGQKDAVVDYDKKYPPEEEFVPPSDAPIDKPSPFDVLFGRGGLTNHHNGNVFFRQLVVMHKQDYTGAAKSVKPRVARKIVKSIRTGTAGNPPGRFLKKKDDLRWYDVGDKHATEKTSQALREKTQTEKRESQIFRQSTKKKSDGEKKSPASEVHTNMPNPNPNNLPPTHYAMYPVPPDIAPGIPTALYPYYQRYEPLYASSFPHYYGVPNSSASNIERKTGIRKHKEVRHDKQETDGGDKGTKKTDPPEHSVDHDKDKVVHVPSIPAYEPSTNYLVEGGIFGQVDKDGDIMLTDHDILCGRGGATNHHLGNKRFRDIVALHRPDYIRAPKVQKPNVARLIVRAIRSSDPPGRFLKKDDNGKWKDIGDKRATEKSSQALREKPSQDKNLLVRMKQNAKLMHTNPSTGMGPHPFYYPMYLYGPPIPGQHFNPDMHGMHPYPVVSASKPPEGINTFGEERQAKTTEEETNDVKQMNLDEVEQSKQEDDASCHDGKRKAENDESLDALPGAKQQRVEESLSDEENIISCNI